LSSFLLPSFSEVVEMPLNAKLLVRFFLAAVVLCVTGGFDFRLSAQELGERLRPDQMADLAAAGLAPADFYPEPGETLDVTAMAQPRGRRGTQGRCGSLCR
jgi:hypothetical protein